MKITDHLFNKVQKKTNVDKDTILSLASRLQDGNMKNETVLRDIVKQISEITGKEVSQEKEDKIVGAILKDQVPDNLDKLL